MAYTKDKFFNDIKEMNENNDKYEDKAFESIVSNLFLQNKWGKEKAMGLDEYDSESGMTYGVDAGTLGIYDIKYCKPIQDSEFVRVIEVDPNEEHEVELEYDAGTFYFSIDGEVIEEIYTAPEEDEEEYEDYYEEDDDEYEEEY